MIVKTKTCFRCKATKPLQDFTKDRKTKDGYKCYCRPCYNSLKSKYYLKLKNTPNFKSKITGPKERFYKLKQQAKKRNLPTTISFELFSETIMKPCFYCSEITFGKATGSGIDRIDSSLGYVEGNIVSCCGACNTIKSDFSLSELKHRLPKILNTIISVEK